MACTLNNGKIARPSVWRRRSIILRLNCTTRIKWQQDQGWSPLQPAKAKAKRGNMQREVLQSILIGQGIVKTCPATINGLSTPTDAESSGRPCLPPEPSAIRLQPPALLSSPSRSLESISAALCVQPRHFVCSSALSFTCWVVWAEVLQSIRARTRRATHLELCAGTILFQNDKQKQHRNNRRCCRAPFVSI